MTSVRWLPAARSDLHLIVRYIARDSRSAATAMMRRVERAVQRLVEFPESGRVVPEYGRDDLRELIVAPYRVVYRYQRERNLVQILQ